MPATLPTVLACLLLAQQPATRPATRPAFPAADAQAAIDAAMPDLRAAVAAGDFPGAAERMQLTFDRHPESPLLASLVGEMRLRADQKDLAVDAFARGYDAAPAEWELLARQVQPLAELGRDDEAQAAVDELARRHEAGEIDAPYFLRERLTMHDTPVDVLHHPSLTGPRAVRYTFVLPGPDGGPTGRYSLGSYDLTNDMLREAGELPEGTRLWHLDYYGPGGLHETHGFYEGEPSYTTAKDAVAAAIAGRPPASSSQKGQINIPAPAGD